jgi:hypothetical protein
MGAVRNLRKIQVVAGPTLGVILSAAQRSEGPLCAEARQELLLREQGSFVAPLPQDDMGGGTLSG